VNRYFSTSNPRRFNVDIYPAIGKVDFLRRISVNSTSKIVCVDIVYFQRRINVESEISCTDMLYFLTSIQRQNSPIHTACRFINVEYTTIPSRGFPRPFDKLRHHKMWNFLPPPPLLSPYVTLNDPPPPLKSRHQSRFS